MFFDAGTRYTIGGITSSIEDLASQVVDVRAFAVAQVGFPLKPRPNPDIPHQDTVTLNAAKVASSGYTDDEASFIHDISILSLLTLTRSRSRSPPRTPTQTSRMPAS